MTCNPGYMVSGDGTYCVATPALLAQTAYNPTLTEMLQSKSTGLFGITNAQTLLLGLGALVVLFMIVKR